jgi:hypothetical protein
MPVHKKSSNEMKNGSLNIYSKGRLRGDKVLYKYGESCTVWYPMQDPEGEVKIEEEDSGICFDFRSSEIDDMIALLQEMKENEADEYDYNTEEEKRREEFDKKQETLTEKIKDALEDIGIHFTPFYWRKSELLITRPQPSGRGTGKDLVYKLCSGVYLGPVCITWGRGWTKFIKSIIETITNKIFNN